MLSFNSVSYSDEDVNKENEETEINLDEEELPAIDPFQSSSAGTSGTSLDGISGITDEGLLNGLKLVSDFMDKTIFKPNNINFPLSRTQFINSLK